MTNLKIGLLLLLSSSAWIGLWFGLWQHSLEAGLWMTSACIYAMFLVWVQFEGE